MFSDLYTNLALYFFTGVALLLVGGSNLLIRRKSHLIKTLASAAIVVSAIGCVWAATEDSQITSQAAILLTCGVGVVLLAGSNRFAEFASKCATAARQPAARWGLLSFAGLVITVGGFIAIEQEDLQLIDDQMAQLETMTLLPPNHPLAKVKAGTDRGNPLALQEPERIRNEAELLALENRMLVNPRIREQLIRSQPASDRTNCHGWVFTGGRYIVLSAQVDRILQENQYKVVADPRPGDLVVYRENGAVVHSAIVRYVTEGQPVLVEGKWGCTSVFLHAVEKSLYGNNFSYYRSPRTGHVLAGIDDPSPIPEVTDIDAANSDEYTD